jgi:hypothetical protein
VRLHDLSVEAERQLLADLMFRPERLSVAVSALTPADFLAGPHRRIWGAMVALYGDGHSPTHAVVGDYLRHTGGDPAVVAGLLDCGTGAVNKHLSDVLRYSRLRSLLAAASEAEQACKNLVDPDTVADELAAALVATHRVVGGGVDGLASFDDVVDTPAAEQAPWVIEGLLREGWRTVLVAAEGSGKMTWLRQIALCASQGVHPLTWRPIPAVRTLVVDLENPIDAVQDGAGRVVKQLRKESGEDYERHAAWLLHEPGGMDLRRRGDKARFEAALDSVRPRLVVVGPLYKAFHRGKGETDEEAAASVAEVFDDLRTRFKFALLLEHHAPKGGAGYRDMVPFGSSLWMRWPEFGLTLEATDVKEQFRVGRFRRDRVVADWPTQLEWAQRFPFAARFDHSAF